jgi:competence protein ComEA
VSNTEKVVICAVLMIFVIGIIFSIKDVRIEAVKKENAEEYVSKTEAIKNSVIDLNKASSMELQFLKGIGPSKADAIVGYREKNGPFLTPEEILNVPGIGEKTLEGIRDRIEVSPEANPQTRNERQEPNDLTKIDINQANIAELESLPGIGGFKAKAIVAYRETFGLFEAYEDLLEVKGIGEKTLEKIRPYIILGE